MEAAGSSRSNTRCSALTASSMYFSSMTTEVLISLVLIIWMLMPSSLSARNILLTYTFKLRSGLAFSDGTPATADDVVFSLTRALNPATGGWTGPFYLSNIVGSDDVTSGASSTLTGVKAVDASTVEIKIKQPSAFFLKQLTFAGGFIVPEAKVTANPANWTDSPIGTGPFKLKEWKHNQALILEPNPYYWNGPIQVTELQMPFFQDSETAFQLYRTGGLDIMGSQQNGVPAARLAEVSDLPDFRADLEIAYHGPRIDRAGLLRYLASFRDHAEFHEQCVERIFGDLMQHCRPQRLSVHARYTRRGGLDINPWRTTPGMPAPAPGRSERQ